MHVIHQIVRLSYVTATTVQLLHAHLKAKKVSHDCSCAAAQLVAEFGKIIQVGLVKGVSHDLNVHLVKVLCSRTGCVRPKS